MHLRFVYDVVCPYAYLASARVEALAGRVGATLVWDPILLGGVFRALGVPERVPKSAAREAVDRCDLHRQAERLGVPLRFHPDHPRRTVEAMRLVLSAPEARRPAVTHALFRAYWVENRDVSDPDTLAGIAREHGVTPRPEAKDALFAAVEAAVGRGVFGVPSFVVGEELFWGADRLGEVEEALGGSVPPVPLGRRGAKLTFFHDFSSPFSYLASTQVEPLAARHGASVGWAPVLVGALFRAIGTPDVPLLEMSAPRRRWFRRDMERRAERLGVPFRFPSTFPLRTVTPLRVALLAPSAVPAIYRAAWADDRDIGDDRVLRDVLGEAGLDPELVGRAGEARDALRASTERAVRAGACGVPTFVVDERHLFWGVDRLDQLEAALAGQAPSADVSAPLAPRLRPG